MKPVTILISFFVISFCTFGQLKTPPANTEKSKLETFTLKTGSLIKKEFIDIGTVAKVEVRVLKISDLVTNTNISGVKFEMKVTKSYTSDTKSCFLDADEIDAFIKSGNLLTSTLNEPGENYTEYQFTSRDGFQAGAYQAKKEWKYFLQLEKYDSDSYAFIDKSDFQKIIDLISEAKKKL